MEYMEDEYLLLSGIQHFRFCRRQWALIHIEQQWAENVHTVVGELMHRKVHDPCLTEKRKDVLVTRALPVSSKILGISGECDVVEFHKKADGVKLYGHRDFYQIYPVEYKKGKSKESEEDVLQLTAQVICLEEMFCTEISEGALFYGETRRRESIKISKEFRSQVANMVNEMHQYYERKYTPHVKYSKRCNSCSLKDICIPRTGKISSAEKYISQAFEDMQ